MRISGIAIAWLAAGCGRLGFAARDDAASVDASSTGDGDSATPNADASLCVSPCFEDNFDSGPLGARWSGFATTQDGTLSLGTNAVSQPNALHATIAASGSAIDRQALLREAIPAMRSIQCSFDLYVAQEATTERSRFLSLFVNNAIWSGYELNAWIQSDGTTLLEEWGICADGTCNFITGNPGAPLGATPRWVHIDFQADYAGSARLYADGNPIAAIALYPQTPSGESFFVGVRSNGTGAWDLSMTTCGAPRRYEDTKSKRSSTRSSFPSLVDLQDLGLGYRHDPRLVDLDARGDVGCTRVAGRGRGRTGSDERVASALRHPRERCGARPRARDAPRHDASRGVDPPARPARRR
jgi:hypothetical protein